MYIIIQQIQEWDMMAHVLHLVLHKNRPKKNKKDLTDILQINS